ncbi:MAG: hypothetical protein HY927_04300 [Elusimicrobia bacterium]|nr:hypothetical protein [Elusimicrobiota bacterium]
MRHLLWGLLSLAVIAGPARADEDPQVAIFSQFNADEQTMMAGILSNPAEAEAFQKEAAAAAGNPEAIKDAVTRWRGKIVAHAADYVDRQPATNMAGKSVKEMVEPAEWGALMHFFRMMEPGIKKDIILGMIKDANEKLAKGDNSRALSVIATARSTMKETTAKYLQTPLAKNAPAEARKLAAAEAQRGKAIEAEKTRIAGEAQRSKALEAEKARKALEAARRAKEIAEKGKNAPAEEAKTGPAPVYDGEPSKETPVVDAGVGPKDPAPVGVTSPQLGGTPDLALNPPKPVEKKPPVILPVPSQGSDEDELAKMESGSGGAKAVKKWAMAGGGLLGLIVGAFFGPIGLVVGLAVGVGVGYLGSKFLLRNA